jgi:spermidine/putrescine transport system ATP-binding protein
VLHHGRLLQVGTPEEIYTAPASAFVANFIGVSNGLSGQVEGIVGQHATVAVEGIGVVHAPAVAGLVAGAPVRVTIRPERLHLSRGPEPDGFQNQVPVRVAKTIYAGNETQYLLTLPNNQTWKVRIPNADGAAKRFRAGESVYLKWRTAEAVLLPE